MADSLDNETLRRDVLAMGAGELTVWKRAVESNKELFDKLFQLIFSAEERLAWRSCWIIDSASEDSPELLEEKLPTILNAYFSTKSRSLKRHFARILCRYPIPESYLGGVVNRSFELLIPSEPAAVRVNAMQLLFNISIQLPEIKGELASVIESLIDEGGSAGFMNRSQKLLRKLRT